MPTLSPLFDLPAPTGDESPDGPSQIAALRDRLEELLSGGDISIVAPGDFKDSVRDGDHGRWLLCDGRELTQVQIETALSLDAGTAADLVTLLGTGAASKFGNAGSGKVKLPDATGKMTLHKSGTHPFKGTGSTGGAEEVTLTMNEAGVGLHGHTVNDSGHSHGPGTLYASTGGAHTHTGNTDSGGAHQHNYLGLSQAADFTRTGGSIGTIGWSGANTSLTVSGGSHAHGFTTESGGAHTHDVEGATASATTGVTVSSTGGPANEGHENMPPYVVVGNLFIRV